jgi:hypothetical protein
MVPPDIATITTAACTQPPNRHAPERRRGQELHQVRRDGHGVRSEQVAPGGDDGVVGSQVTEVRLEEGQRRQKRRAVLHDAGQVGPQVR